MKTDKQLKSQKTRIRNLNKKVKTLQTELSRLQETLKSRDKEIIELLNSFQVKIGQDKKDLVKLINELIDNFNVTDKKEETLKAILSIFNRVPVNQISVQSIAESYRDITGYMVSRNSLGREVELKFYVSE